MQKKEQGTDEKILREIYIPAPFSDKLLMLSKQMGISVDEIVSEILKKKLKRSKEDADR